jgi:RNA polymerase sigma factor (sigma-70 family)
MPVVPVLVEDVQVITGPRAEIERVFREDGPRLWRALLAFQGNPDIATEARAEAFAQALAAADSLRSPASWIWVTAFRIASRTAAQRRTEVPLGEGGTYELAEPIQDLVAGLAALPPRQRMAIVLHDYADRPTDEIAAVLGITRSTVLVHLSAGRKRLRKLLEEPQDA